MSFGRPPNFSTFSVTPPDRGSFPLDHEGECSKAMKEYMTCMKQNKMDNGKCRHLSKLYLQCRMDNGLMEKDEMSNLGFHESDSSPLVDTKQTPQQQSQSQPKGRERMV